MYYARSNSWDERAELSRAVRKDIPGGRGEPECRSHVSNLPSEPGSVTVLKKKSMKTARGGWGKAMVTQGWPGLAVRTATLEGKKVLEPQAPHPYSGTKSVKSVRYCI